MKITSDTLGEALVELRARLIGLAMLMGDWGLAESVVMRDIRILDRILGMLIARGGTMAFYAERKIGNTELDTRITLVWELSETVPRLCIQGFDGRVTIALGEVPEAITLLAIGIATAERMIAAKRPAVALGGALTPAGDLTGVKKEQKRKREGSPWSD